MSKHTPGPWTYDQGQYADWGCVRDASGFLVAKAVVPYGTDENTCRRERIDPCEASARLISAAPDLLAALNRFDVDGLELEGDEEIDITMTAEDLRILRAALAKAKGGEP